VSTAEDAEVAWAVIDRAREDAVMELVQQHDITAWKSLVMGPHVLDIPEFVEKSLEVLRSHLTGDEAWLVVRVRPTPWVGLLLVMGTCGQLRNWGPRP
jgi:hypothetical protein